MSANALSVAPAAIPFDEPTSPAETEGHRTGDVVAQRFRLIRPMASGGMGVLWVAHALTLDVKVAIKLLRSDVRDADAGERLAREARAIAQLDHPNIIRVIDFGIAEEGQPFLVTELLRGEDLGSLLEREGAIDPALAVQLILPIVDALASAHDKGIVHRDLKPDNLFLARDDQDRVMPKVLDFGIAKLANQASINLTGVDTVLGSPAYMAPEQALGTDNVDGRADIWSLSVLLYELTTGQLPFAGADTTALFAAILHQAALPLTVDAGLNEIVQRGLAKPAHDRWANMREVGRALASWLLSRGINEDIVGNSVSARWLGRPGSSAAVLVEPPHEIDHRATQRQPPAQPSLVTILGGDAVESPKRPRSLMPLFLGLGAVVAVAWVAVALLIMSAEKPPPAKPAATEAPTTASPAADNRATEDAIPKGVPEKAGEPETTPTAADQPAVVAAPDKASSPPSLGALPPKKPIKKQASPSSGTSKLDGEPDFGF